MHVCVKIEKEEQRSYHAQQLKTCSETGQVDPIRPVIYDEMCMAIFQARMDGGECEVGCCCLENDSHSYEQECTESHTDAFSTQAHEGLRWSIRGSQKYVIVSHA
jgi:hypothetical protein